MTEEERLKQTAINRTVREARRAADRTADILVEAIAQWYENWRDNLPDPDAAPDPRLAIQVPKNARLQLAQIPRGEILRLMRDALAEGSPFTAVFDGILGDASVIDQANLQIQQRLNDIDLDLTRFDPERVRLLNEVQAGLAVEPLTSLAADRVVRTITAGVLLNRPLAEVFDNLEEIVGRSLSGYATLLSRDGLYGYDGAVNDVIRKTYDLNAYRYVGSIVEDSRPHCRRWVKERLLRREYLEQEIGRLHAAGNPDGFRTQTTFENFAQYRGGYNCRHTAVPVRARD